MKSHDRRHSYLFSETPTGGDDHERVFSAPVNDPLVNGTTNVISPGFTITDPNYPPSKHLYVHAFFSAGTNPTAHVQLWVCGRGPQAIEQMPAQPSFAAQYAAAKMLEDENRLPARKRLLAPGRSERSRVAFVHLGARHG